METADYHKHEPREERAELLGLMQPTRHACIALTAQVHDTVRM
jgi:hypothetical protein